MKYSKEEFLMAAKIGEVSILDAKHIISCLEEAVDILSKPFDCRICVHVTYNVFDQKECKKGYLIPIDDCESKLFEKGKRFL